MTNPTDESLAGAAAFTQPDPAAAVREPSIVDTILNLDEFLSGDVRLAEKTARFCTKPDLEGTIDELEQQLGLLVDGQGRPAAGSDEALSGASTAGQAYDIAQQLHAVRQEYAAAMRSVRLRQLDDTKWQAFRDEHRDAFKTTEQTPERKAMLDQLVVKSSFSPKITLQQLTQMRGRVGAPVIDELVAKAWAANTESGVSVPKSPLSLAVLRQQGPARS
jgi:hypothetical protein